MSRDDRLAFCCLMIGTIGGVLLTLGILYGGAL